MACTPDNSIGYLIHQLNNKVQIILSADDIRLYDAAADACTAAILVIESIEARLIAKAISHPEDDPMHSGYNRAKAAKATGTPD